MSNPNWDELATAMMDSKHRRKTNRGNVAAGLAVPGKEDDPTVREAMDTARRKKKSQGQKELEEAMTNRRIGK